MFGYTALALTDVEGLCGAMRFHKATHATDLRPIVGAEPTQVALAWERANDSAEVQAFIGIVRGRTAQSSRG